MSRMKKHALNGGHTARSDVSDRRLPDPVQKTVELINNYSNFKRRLARALCLYNSTNQRRLTALSDDEVSMGTHAIRHL